MTIIAAIIMGLALVGMAAHTLLIGANVAKALAIRMTLPKNATRAGMTWQADAAILANFIAFMGWALTFAIALPFGGKTFLAMVAVGVFS